MAKPKAEADLTDDDDAGSPPDPDVQGSVGGADQPGDEPDPNEVGRVEVEGDGPPIDAPAAAIADPGPPPITPASSQQQYDDRVAYEDGVNKQFEAWLDQNRGEMLATFLAGGTVDLQHNLPDADDAAADLEPKS